MNTKKMAEAMNVPEELLKAELKKNEKIFKAEKVIMDEVNKLMKKHKIIGSIAIDIDIGYTMAVMKKQVSWEQADKIYMQKKENVEALYK